MPEPDRNLTGDQERVEAMWSPLQGVIIVRNTASGDKIEFGEEAWQAFLDGHRGISGESGRRLAALGVLHAPLYLIGPGGRHAICAHCCTWGEERRRTRECEDDHGHGPDKPRCMTAVILEGGEIGE